MSQRQINIIPLIHFLSSSELKCKTETLSVFFFLFQTKTDVLQMQLMLKNNSPLKQRHEEETEELSNFTQRNKSDKSRECKTVLKTFFGGWGGDA